MREFHFPAQYSKYRFSDHTALVVSQLGMRAEKTAGGGVSGTAETQNVRQQRLCLSYQKSMKPHTPSPAMSAKSHCGSGGVSTTRSPSMARRPSTNQRTARG